MLEWVVFIGILFFTGWILHTFAFTPFSAAAAPAPASAATQQIATQPQDYKPESWCFVGENTLGRLCVKTSYCPAAENRFPSREDCEYTEASALPLGVTGEHGLYYNPFSSPRENRYHTF